MKMLCRIACAVVLLAAPSFPGIGSAYSQSNVGEADSSVATLVEEIRQLRAAIAESAKQQAEIQSLSVYLSVQQSRMVQLADRLDSVRIQLAGAVEQSRHASQLLVNAENDLQRTTNPQARDEVSGLVQMFKQQAVAASEKEQQVRQWEMEILRAFQVEEQRWSDLIRRLEAAAAHR